MSIDFRFEHPSNADNPIDVTLDGMLIDFNEEHP